MKIGTKLLAFAAAAAMLFTVPAFGDIPQTNAAGQDASSAVSEDIGLVGNLYTISGSSNADHAGLQWATTLSAESYVLYR